MVLPDFGFAPQRTNALPNPYANVPQTPLSRMRTEAARSGVLGPLAPSGAPGFNTPLNQLVRERRAREGSTGQQVVDTGAGEDTSTRQTTPYPTTLPPLSPEMLAAIEARRAASTRQLAEAEAQAASLRQRAELENVGRMLGIEEETGRERRSGLTELAARGVARSPLFANPFRRELARQQQQQIGESQQQLTRTLDQLQSVLQGARQQRERELAQIDFDVAQGRSNVGRLLGIN